MSSGPISLHILAHPDAIKLWRSILGPTKIFKGQYEKPDSLRGRFGISDTRNVAHGSDSQTSARLEISFFFPSFDYAGWFQNEHILRKNQSSLIFDYEKQIHIFSEEK